MKQEGQIELQVRLVLVLDLLVISNQKIGKENKMGGLQ